jgi:polyisoprenoid-binding protein YceI
MKRDFIVGVFVALAICLPQSGVQAKSVAPAKVDAPAGVYTLDKAHASLIFRISHMGFSHFTGRLSRFEATLQFDPAHPVRSHVEATIDPLSLASDNPPAGFLDSLHGPEWLDAGKFSAITFRSTKVQLTGRNTARITGDFTLHGVTHSVVLNATFNGGYPGMSLDPHARIGFSAHGVFKRSQFSIAFGIPAPGSNMGVGDEVEVIIEAEFNGPAWKPEKNKE